MDGNVIVYNNRFYVQTPDGKLYPVTLGGGGGGGGGGISRTSIQNIVNQSIIPLSYQLNAFDLPSYDLDLRFMGDKLLGIFLLTVTINSIKLPTNNILTSINISLTTLNENLNLDISAYGNLQNLFLSDFIGVNILNLESSPSLKNLTLSSVQNIAGDTFSIGSLNNVTTLQQISISAITKLTSIGNIQNLPALFNFFIINNAVLATIGNMDGNTALSTLNISTNLLLINVGSMTGLSALLILNISFNPILSAIGSLTGQTSCLQYFLNNNNFSGAVLSQILIDIDNNGTIGGFLTLNAQTTGAGQASLTPAGLTALDFLQGTNFSGNNPGLSSKGWTIIIDP